MHEGTTRIVLDKREKYYTRLIAENASLLCAAKGERKPNRGLSSKVLVVKRPRH